MQAKPSPEVLLPLTALLLLAGAAACGELEPPDPVNGASPAPGAAAGKADLPNASFIEREHDGSGYAAIARWYTEQGHDLRVDRARAQVAWPLRESTRAVLNRFGTPVINGSAAYFHTAVDITRARPTNPDAVLAPVGGLAMVFDWWGKPGAPGSGYATVVAILDRESHLIAQLMHVQPAEVLLAAGGAPVEVERGQVIGRLAEDLAWLSEPADRERYRHVHLDLVDGEQLLALDPIPLLPYRDRIAPTVRSTYLLDAEGRKHDALRPGEVDLVVEVFDRDRDSHRNLEIASLAFELRDAEGNVLRSLDRCHLEDLYAAIDRPYPSRARELLDLGNARAQSGLGAWGLTDSDNPERTFRYALTQLVLDEAGRCRLLDDDEGYFVVPESLLQLELTVTLWDPSGNVTTHRAVLAR